MYIPITFLEDLSTDYLKIGRKISSQGGAKVYKTYLHSKKKAYALKMFPNDNSGTNQYKKEIIISDLSHPNIIKYIPATIEFPNANDFHYILTEYAKYGRLFDMVSEGVITSEVLVRTYFHQIVAGLGYIHSQGFAHLDLKLENLMLGSGFELKIIDFDLAQGVKEKKITSGGTNGYRAPEVIDGSCTNFKAADIYSLGIILYTLKAQSAPFTEIRIQNAKGEPATSLMYYSTFLQNNSAFWELRAAQKNDFAFFSEDFKKLINGMLEFDVSKRSTIGDIRSSKWFNGPILSNEELRAEMKARWRLLKTK